MDYSCAGLGAKYFFFRNVTSVSGSRLGVKNVLAKLFIKLLHFGGRDGSHRS
jgi:hypothetical protein